MYLTGRTALLALLGVVPLGFLPGVWTAVAWAALCLVGVAADLAVAAPPAALRVAREQPPPVRLGEGVAAALTVTNTGRRRLRGQVRDAWQPSAGAGGDDGRAARHPVDLPPGDARRLVTGLRPVRRGDRLVRAVVVRSAGPLGLAGRQRVLPAPGRLRVLPPFTSRKHLPSRLSRLRELDGRTALRVRGQGTEFDSLRDYVGGDDVRSIDWRATARRQQVVVRTWRPERDRRLLLVLDTSRTAAGRVGDAPRLDAAMDAALLLAALASRAGDRVDLVAVDSAVRARVEGRSRTELLPALVDALAPLDAELVEADWDLIASTVLTRLPQRALVVLLTPLEAAAVEQGLLPVVPALTARHLVMVASVADPALDELAGDGRDDGTAPADAYAVYGAAAAERARLGRGAVTAELVRAGVEVVDASPDDLPPRLADRYLALKAAGRL